MTLPRMDEATNKLNTGLLRGLGRYGVRLRVAEDVDDDFDIVREDHVDMAVVGVGRLEDPGRLHDPVGGELVDDQGHEAHLIDGELRLVR